MRDHLRTPERRERPLGVLAQTVMNLRALLARRFAPPAPPPAQRDYTLSRRATPSWMADALVRPDAAEPDVARVAPPEPWTQSPFAPAPGPVRTAPSVPHAASPAAPVDHWAPDPALGPAPLPDPVLPSRAARGDAQGRYGGERADVAQAWPRDSRPQNPVHQNTVHQDPVYQGLPPQGARPPLPETVVAPAEPFRAQAPDPGLPAEPDILAPPAVVVAPEVPAPRRAASSHWAPDPALMPDGGWTMPIPPAGPARAVLTRARRRDAEPSAAASEARSRPSPQEQAQARSQERSPDRPSETGVRFTRTPDHVLQARHRRREQALREKEEALRAAEAEAASRAAAELAAAEAARAEAEAARIEAEAAAAAAAVPIWRQPFVLPPGVRFTRTPDHLLRHPQEEPIRAEAVPEAAEGAVPEPVAGEAASGPEASDAAAYPAAESVAAVESAEAVAAFVPEDAQAFVETPGPIALDIAAPASVPAEEAPVVATYAEASVAEPAVIAPETTASESAAPAPEAAPSTPDLPAQEPAAEDAPVAPAQVFDVPNSAILVPVDVSHLRSLPPRPVYTLDRLLQHDWTCPLPTAAEQDNRPVPEPVADEATAEALPTADAAPPVEPVIAEAVVAAPVMPTEMPPADPPPDVPLVGLPPVDFYPADFHSMDLPPEPVAETVVEVAMEIVPAVSAPGDEVFVAVERDAPADLPPAAILLPAPAPMLALTYAPLPEPVTLLAPVELEFPAAPLALPVAGTVAEAAVETVPVIAPEPAPAVAPPPTAPLAFTPVPWSFIAADALPVTQPETAQVMPAETRASTLASTLAEDRPAAELIADPASPSPRGAQPFVYVPTGRLNAPPPAPTLPAPPRPPRIILPVATQPVPIAQQPVPVAAPSEPVAAHPASPAPVPEPVATAPSWSPVTVEKPAAEPHGLVIGTAGLDCDLGLDADEDGDDEDDILAPVATIPLRQAARLLEVPYELPSVDLLAEPRESDGSNLDPEMLEDNALQLQQVIQDFGVRGEILAVRPGPVVTLYEMEPAPGTKSSRVISLADDIARSMSAISARVAVVQGRNAIGIELPNLTRETVYLRELLTSPVFTETKQKLALCLGKNIGGEAIIADLARMPHLLVAGTTGSGKSVAINTMILSLLYRLKPEECRLIMVDPKMLELSVYDGIPHLLSPVVTDPKKAVIALKWAVREMEER
ncbi:DNA translocase FtsK, partial [Methylobacterium sp. EM32]|uniref:DNA translocase FtsK n=1 Tax=Methylobacterium sp. EM32 TaxID=3163481 RepID=UPI0033AE3701